MGSMSGFYQLFGIKHGPFRDPLNEVIGRLLAEVQGFEGPGAGVSIGIIEMLDDAGQVRFSSWIIRKTMSAWIEARRP